METRNSFERERVESYTILYIMGFTFPIYILIKLKFNVISSVLMSFATVYITWS